MSINEIIFEAPAKEIGSIIVYPKGEYERFGNDNKTVFAKNIEKIELVNFHGSIILNIQTHNESHCVIVGGILNLMLDGERLYCENEDFNNFVLELANKENARKLYDVIFAVYLGYEPS